MHFYKAQVISVSGLIYLEISLKFLDLALSSVYS